MRGSSTAVTFSARFDESHLSVGVTSIKIYFQLDYEEFTCVILFLNVSTITTISYFDKSLPWSKVNWSSCCINAPRNTLDFQLVKNGPEPKPVDVRVSNFNTT